jgi:hypothetical protein
MASLAAVAPPPLQEMEKTAKLMQEDLPLTFQDMQRTSKEFEILGKQLNHLTGVVVRPRRTRCRCHSPHKPLSLCL